MSQDYPGVREFKFVETHDLPPAKYKSSGTSTGATYMRMSIELPDNPITQIARRLAVKPEEEK